jgi:L-threonylcarbamoyladenylate synthase
VGVSAPISGDVGAAVAALRAGALVALPTETVYGLAADASSVKAVARVFAAKGRPASHPVIVHLPSVRSLDDWAAEVPFWARSLAATVWPGPLTLVVPKASTVLGAVTGGQETVGLRVPSHHVTLQVLERFDGGLAAPSANRYGRVSPTTAQHVVAELGDALDAERGDLVLDGGPCPVGVESTIVGAWDETPRLLRPGAVTAEQVAELTGLDVSAGPIDVRVPGSTQSHYAPTSRVMAVEADALSGVLESLESTAAVGVIAPEAIHVTDSVVRLASPSDDDEYARQLYSALRKGDLLSLDIVVAVLPQETGVGRAVRDRLLRAADHQVTR